MKTYIKNFKKNDKFIFNEKTHTVIQKINESDTKDFCIKATVDGDMHLFWYDELEVYTIIPVLENSIVNINNLIEKQKTDSTIDLMDLLAEKRYVLSEIKRIKRQCK